jgi:hypothetical protein
MKTTRFLFSMIIGAGLLQGTSLASQSNSATQQTPSQKTEQSTSDQQTNGEVRGDNKQMLSAQADEGTRPPAGASRTAKHRSRASSSKPVSTHPAAPAKTPTTNNHQSEVLGSVATQQQTGLEAVTGVSSKTASHRSVPTPPSTVAVNGQQFKSSRDPGAHLASSGGPLTAARGTAAINGTTMKRKP